MKVITVCGSYKYQKEMQEITEELALQRNCLLTPIELTKKNKDAYSIEELTLLGNMHKEKIKLSDAILVVNINNYIGESTKSEIEYAKSLDKEIIYYTDLIK